MNNRSFIFIALILVLAGAAAAFVIAGSGSSVIGSAKPVEMPRSIAADERPNETATSNENAASLAADIPREEKDSRRRDALIDSAVARTAPALSTGQWINSEPTTLEKLRGQVVFVDFWTFGCYNCINTLPALKSFQAKYAEKGFTVVGVETPETEREKSFDNLKQAVKKRGIEYPVVSDYNGDSWRAFDVEAWPTVFILDKKGRIRYTHVGEGSYDVQEKVIQMLLHEENEKIAQNSDEVYTGEKIVKTEADWRKLLTPAQFSVLREKGTERAFTGELADNHEHGDYYCAACHLKLFKSDAKFESGTGWPSFYQPIASANVTEETDNSLGESRTEVLCSRCRSHLGHIFDDGPKPTGLRYCMNSVALKFEKRK